MRKPKVKKRGSSPNGDKQAEKPIGHVSPGTLGRDVKNLERVQGSRALRPPGRA